MTFITSEHDELLKAQEEFEAIENKWKKLVSKRDKLITEWNEVYENPILLVKERIDWVQTQIKIDNLDITNYQDDIDEMETELENLIDIKRNNPQAKELREQKMEAIKSVEKYLPVYSNAGVKFRKARSKFMKNSLFGREYF